MKKEIKEMRSYQIAAIILLRYIDGIEISESQYPYYDLLVTDKTTGLRFGIEVKFSSFERTQEYRSYIQTLSRINLNDENNRIPILIMAVNESKETAKVGFVMGWRFDKAYIYEKPSFIEVTKENSEKILDIIKAMDQTIRLLSNQGLKIKKTINITCKGYHGIPCRGQIVYLRDFTDQYKMYQKVIINERERFERLFYGIPEEEYPSDILDQAIIEMVQQEFPNSSIKSDLLLFSSELRDLQVLSQSKLSLVKFQIIPDVLDLSPEIYELLGATSSIDFNLELFTVSRIDYTTFGNIKFSLSKSSEEWLEMYNNYKGKLSTLHNPSEFFIESAN
jgi:hypothetical protein